MKEHGKRVADLEENMRSLCLFEEEEEARKERSETSAAIEKEETVFKKELEEEANF